MVVDAYQDWLEQQIRASAGERRRRLSAGLGHAERLFVEAVWLPAAGSFEHLHAEYEVRDFRDGVRFLDFAYVKPPHKVALEQDGFGPHARDIDRRAFADGLMRQNHLVLENWIVLRFAYDDLKQNPRACQQILQQLLGRLYRTDSGERGLSLQQREVLRIADLHGKPLKPGDVASQLGVGIKSARRLLQSLLHTGHLTPLGGEAKIHQYVRRR